jgi:parallel beta-helix repeat protein
VTLTNNTVSGNTAVRGGGGIFFDYHGRFTLSNSTLTGNSASQYGGRIFMNYDITGNLNTL